MKKIWKILGVAALAASIPFVIRTDPETKERSYDALLWQVRTRPNPETGKTEVTAVSILPTRRIRNGEAELFEDDGVYACYPDSCTDIVESDEPGPF